MKIKFLAHIFILFFLSCNNKYKTIDEAIEIPVVENGLIHGNTLTNFGILVNSSWEYSSEFRNGVYVLDGLNNKETLDYEIVTFTNNEKELVFELLKKENLNTG